jgi:hypothetical protein
VRENRRIGPLALSRQPLARRGAHAAASEEQVSAWPRELLVGRAEQIAVTRWVAQLIRRQLEHGEAHDERR